MLLVIIVRIKKNINLTKYRPQSIIVITLLHCVFNESVYFLMEVFNENDKKKKNCSISIGLNWLVEPVGLSVEIFH